MRDAVQFESRGIPTVILVNDVFKPIAHATAALLELPADYVSNNIIWLPHPTSNLTPDAAAALIDRRIDSIRSAFLGRARAAVNVASETGKTPLETARTIVEGLAASLRVDGADLVLTAIDDGVLAAELHIGELNCEDGSCIMPAEQLEKMVDAMVRPHLPAVRSVRLREVRLV